MMTLCIAELADGRSALAYIDAVGMVAELVCILRPEDLLTYHANRDGVNQALAKRGPLTVKVDIEGLTDWAKLMIEKHGNAATNLIVGAQPLDIPRPRPKPRISVDDLLNMGKDQKPEPPKTPQEKLLDDIERLQRGDDPTK